MTEIIWEEPPPIAGRARDVVDPRIEAMKADPKRWLVWLREGSAGATTSLKRHHPGFEFVSRRTQPGTRGTIYARYVGE